MKKDAKETSPWWADYSGRCIGFLMLVGAACAIPAGVLRAILVLHFGFPDWLLSSIAWGLSMWIPLSLLLWMRRSGRDGWLLRKDLRDARAAKRSNI